MLSPNHMHTFILVRSFQTPEDINSNKHLSIDGCLLHFLLYHNTKKVHKGNLMIDFFGEISMEQ